MALLIPADGVVLVGIDTALLPELEASGKVEAFFRLEDLRSGVDAAGTIGQDEGTSPIPVQRRTIRYDPAGAGPDARDQLPTAAGFRAVLDSKFADAAQRGLTSLVVRAGDFHHEVGGYPSAHHRMPVCCSVMRERMQPGDRVVAEPPKGAGASLEIEYRLPR